MEVYRECKIYEEILLPEEEVEWQGKPETLPLLTSECKTAVLVRWIVCAALFVVLTILYAVLASNAGAPFHLVVVLVLFVALAYISIIPIQDRNNIHKKVHYYVTNKRVILAVGKSLYALNRNGINTKCIPSDCDCVHISFGSCADKAGRTYRRYTVMPEIDDDDPSKNGFVFYGVKVGKDRLKDLLSV